MCVNVWQCVKRGTVTAWSSRQLLELHAHLMNSYFYVNNLLLDTWIDQGQWRDYLTSVWLTILIISPLSWATSRKLFQPPHKFDIIQQKNYHTFSKYLYWGLRWELLDYKKRNVEIVFLFKIYLFINLSLIWSKFRGLL